MRQPGQTRRHTGLICLWYGIELALLQGMGKGRFGESRQGQERGPSFEAERYEFKS
jgi:hypothetical protein